MDHGLRELAQAAGVAVAWKDVFGVTHDVSPATVRAVLDALGYPTASSGDLADSLHRAVTPPPTLPPLVTADAGQPIHLPAAAAPYSLCLEDGRGFEGHASPGPHGCTIPPILEAGYHHVIIGDAETVIAVAPPKGFTAPEAMGAPRGWGLAVQLYALRGKSDAGIGDFAALAKLAGVAARHGAQALAISPVHAQFSADPDRFSPYAPSSRTALNVLHASIDVANPLLASLDLIDWPTATRFRLAEQRRIFASAARDPAQVAALADFRAQQGERLQSHAVFEALHGHFFSRSRTLWHWRSWPAAFQDPASDAVAEFVEANAQEVTFHAWLQFRAELGLTAAQAACKDAGMGIGLISDLAVGTDSGGSQCWSRQEETLLGLTVGAPPDLLQRNGQNWGLTGFSPTGMRATGFRTYRDMLHTALAHAGGMRIDHAMGLNRLWVIPDGASGAEGAYLAFPETDLMRLIRLESQRRRAIVLAEDLGTVPEGFQDRLRESGIEGMRVLWFERDQAQHFVSPSHWTPCAAAMTSTHDLPTLAGWWAGRDIDWRERLGQVPDPAAARAERASDRTRIWNAFRHSGATTADQPADDSGAAFADAACIHVGRSACELVVLPIEDALALIEQPNLPGTLHEHPNWQRRLPDDAGVLLEAAGTAGRLRALSEARRSF